MAILAVVYVIAKGVIQLHKRSTERLAARPPNNAECLILCTLITSSDNKSRKEIGLRANLECNNDGLQFFGFYDRISVYRSAGKRLPLLDTFGVQGIVYNRRSVPGKGTHPGADLQLGSRSWPTITNTFRVRMGRTAILVPRAKEGDRETPSGRSKQIIR